jgi:hypothetical protein
MSINCEVIVRWGATPEQLRALGAALWRWCIRSSATTGIYPYLDNQILADLIDGQLPASPQPPRQSERDGPYFNLRDEVSRTRQAAIDSLRQALPDAGLADIMVDGISWDRAGAKDGISRIVERVTTANLIPVIATTAKTWGDNYWRRS